jgi:hypothetical protein
VLASEPYCKRIVAVESRAHVVVGAKRMDVRAKVGRGVVVWRDKKRFREEGGWKGRKGVKAETQSCDGEVDDGVAGSDLRCTEKATGLEGWETGKGSVQYLEHRIEDGDLSAVIEQIVDHHPDTEISNGRPPPRPSDPAIMVVSLHSCGNLLHHGLRTISLNPAVKVVAMVGCCYNLMTERLGPRTYKFPSLRYNHPRLVETSSMRDPHGFPMSNRFMEHRHRVPRPPTYSEELESDHTASASEEPASHVEDEWETGIRLNITARMMAVQAPTNWSPAESAAFFTRHFYRALLQRIFVDKGVLAAPPTHEGVDDQDNSILPESPTDADTPSQVPIIIGHLSKPHYATFTTYIRGAVQKLLSPTSPCPAHTHARIRSHIASLSDGEIAAYEARFAPRKKELSVVWSLMAFSSQAVEAMIVVDRWAWLTEQEGVREAWVQTGFGFELSPRNLVVVGVRG